MKYTYDKTTNRLLVNGKQIANLAGVDSAINELIDDANNGERANNLRQAAESALRYADALRESLAGSLSGDESMQTTDGVHRIVMRLQQERNQLRDTLERLMDSWDRDQDERERAWTAARMELHKKVLEIPK